MQVTVLIIIYREKEHITIHDNDAAAWSELVKFIDTKWDEHLGLETPRPEDEEDRSGLFFRSESDYYIMANADVSQIAAQIEAVIRA